MRVSAKQQQMLKNDIAMKESITGLALFGSDYGEN